MASFTCHNSTMPGPLGDFRLQGQTFHRIGGIQATNANDAKFFQVFFTSADEVTQQDLAMHRANIEGSTKSRSIMQKLRNAVVRCNPLFKTSKAMEELYKDSGTQGQERGRAGPGPAVFII